MSIHYLSHLDLSGVDLDYSFYYGANYYSPNDEDLDPSHIHDYYEIYVNVSGDVSFLVNNKLYSINRGDVVVSHPGDVHVCVFNSACIHEHFCLWISDSGNGLLKKIFTDKKSGIRKGYFSFEPEESTALIEKLYALNKAETDSKELQRFSCVFDILSMLDSGSAKEVNGQEMSIPEEMKRILDHIDRHFMDIDHVSNITDTSYISSATLNRWFKKYLDLTPREFIEAKKLSYAKSLLDRGASVTDACLGAGFKDCSRFISVFKRKFGVTPLKYRNSKAK